jgi:hypothetical protein
MRSFHHFIVRNILLTLMLVLAICKQSSLKLTVRLNHLLTFLRTVDVLAAGFLEYCPMVMTTEKDHISTDDQ